MIERGAQDGGGACARDLWATRAEHDEDPLPSPPTPPHPPPHTLISHHAATRQHLVSFRQCRGRPWRPVCLGCQ